MEEKNPEAILEEQIRESRQTALREIYKKPQNNDPTTGMKDNRENKRLKFKYLNILDGLVQKFLEARMTLDDPDGNEAEAKLVYFHEQWKRSCNKFNKRPRAQFSLRIEAFMQRVEYFLDLEKAQIKAAKEAHKTHLFEKWLRRNEINMKWRKRWYQVKSGYSKFHPFLKNKTVKELFRAYWDKIQVTPMLTEEGRKFTEKNYPS